MVKANYQYSKPSRKLLEFLSEKLALSDKAIKLGIRQSELENAPLPVVLWSFGIINVSQLSMILKWERLNQ